jgi:hypothetical protein
MLCACACVLMLQEAHEELRMLQRKGAVAPPSLVPNAGEDDYNRTLHDDRLLSADSFDFTRSKPLTPDPGTIAATAHIHKCPGRRQGKSGFSGMCEIFNEFELHFQVCLLVYAIYEKHLKVFTLAKSVIVSKLMLVQRSLSVFY